jgi:hypothetical protein
LLHLTGWLHPSISNVKNEITQEQEHVACNENEIERYEISRLDRDTGYGMDMDIGQERNWHILSRHFFTNGCSVSVMLALGVL